MFWQKSWNYPLLKEVEAVYKSVDLSDVLVLACQHLLGAQYRMFSGLLKLGLRPKNCVVIGKNYSSNSTVISKLQTLGVKLAPFSSAAAFDPEQSFDVWFNRQLLEYVGNELSNRRLEDYRKIVVLDDGAHLHAVCNTLLAGRERVAGVEQTSSGHNRIRSLGIFYPVLSVAKWWTKINLESPLIAELACSRIAAHLAACSKRFPNVLVLGLGPIGRQTAGKLTFLDAVGSISCYDPASAALRDNGAVRFLENRGEILTPENLRDRASQFEVIVGATGQETFGEETIANLHPEVSLISVSSSDREFPAVPFRRGQNKGIHEDFYLGRRCLVNGGFPITFYGNYDEMEPKRIELTVASLQLAVLSAAGNADGFPVHPPYLLNRLATSWLSNNQ